MVEPYAHPEVLVSTEWVSQHLDDSTLAIVEVSAGLPAEYNQGHVPGAVGWGLHTDLEHQVRRDVPSVAQMEALLGRSGIDNDTAIIIYGDGNNRSATWAFWVLKYYRHESVRLMNGGRRRWIDEGRPLTAEMPAPEAKTYRAAVPDRSLRALKEYLLANLSSRTVKVLDTRTNEEYAGLLTSSSGTAQADIYRRGHIPGAVNIPWDDAAAEDGTFRPAEELREMYAGEGLGPDDEVVPYCRLGMRSSYSWFVLKYLLGYPRVRNYDGSWTEWGNSTGVPIETGDPQGPL